MRNTLIPAAMIAVFALTGGAALAGDRPDFASLDQDGDGSVSLAEMTAAAQARQQDRIAQAFARHDTDGDGIISAAEFDAAKVLRAERQAQRRDHWRPFGRDRGHGNADG